MSELIITIGDDGYVHLEWEAPEGSASASLGKAKIDQRDNYTHYIIEPTKSGIDMAVRLLWWKRKTLPEETRELAPYDETLNPFADARSDNTLVDDDDA